MLFCPTCGNMLLIEGGAGTKFFCTTCPYIQRVTTKITKSITLERKTVDDVLGGAAAWENVDQTDALCPACGHRRAYFMQLQIRSADEPMTTFYKCVACSGRWND
ncbi:hypothetical protein FNF27_03305 [Cafeteria roenbergensis]|uniref:DNA-directed RNA polymerase subunit n=2 Tax=Cafeteria roenbergensis TaxID=33653 RepID=A0A5A8CRT2_CAFRO|nr:hypothetical protein FNF29_07959 [Cafeteria roenbergensis]KAA0155805.1 hypothetical protein FNF31_06047 [Cafeteria roenbergensis]KAA0175297.1 hypothetical protein FNF27_03305 [Cafeteria roenbergensis]|eukprot:KAA0146626.1 hypothetical protein FNF29_07959 [Cafeteria roenbergensis]